MALDLETIGLDFKNNVITEAATVTKKLGAKKALAIKHSYLYEEDRYTAEQFTPEIYKLTYITRDLCLENGVDPQLVLKEISDEMKTVDFVLAQNGVDFDRPFLAEQMNIYGIDPSPVLDAVWIDTKQHIRWPFRSTHLGYIAAELGFLNPFPHDALSDTMTTFKVFETAIKEGYVTFDKMVERATGDDVWLMADVGFHTKDKAKKGGFHWENSNGLKFPKLWVKKICECDLDDEMALYKNIGFSAMKIKQALVDSVIVDAER